MADVCKTDLLKAIAYLEEAVKLYDALTIQTITTAEGRKSLIKLCRIRPGWGKAKYKCRAHIINQLTTKLKIKLNDKK